MLRLPDNMLQPGGYFLTALRHIGLLVAAAVFLLAVGCSRGEPTATPTPTPTPQATATSTPSPTSAPLAASTLRTVLQEALFLDVVEPANESTVREVPLVVVGRTTPDAVVSVDGQTTEVNARGEFVALVSLETGPNLIQVVASDLNGNQETALLAVIYLPQS